jgi:hypothetical protein
LHALTPVIALGTELDKIYPYGKEARVDKIIPGFILETPVNSTYLPSDLFEVWIT